MYIMYLQKCTFFTCNYLHFYCAINILMEFMYLVKGVPADKVSHFINELIGFILTKTLQEKLTNTG